MFEWLNNQDPLVRSVVLGAAGLILLVLLVKLWGGRREARAAARRQADLRQTYEQVRLQQEEIRALAARIEATSSTSRIAGYNVMRQIETVFADSRSSSASAVELAKALAVQKGGNALINLQVQQSPNGKWTAIGDAVVVLRPARRTATPPKSE